MDATAEKGQFRTRASQQFRGEGTDLPARSERRARALLRQWLTRSAWVAADIVRIEDGKLAEHGVVPQDEATTAQSVSGCRCSASGSRLTLPHTSWVLRCSLQPLAQAQQRKHDVELIAASTLLHDIGLIAAFTGEIRFEMITIASGLQLGPVPA
jgi:hypothetical protein